MDSRVRKCILLQHYQQNDLKLRRFVPIIKQSVVYPVLYDANRTVLSLPPIINGAHSQVFSSSCKSYSIKSEKSVSYP